MSLLQMSFSGAVMILVIILLRSLTINKFPKNVFRLLWEIVILRLLIPFSIPSIFSAYSLMGRSTPVKNVIDKTPVGNMIPQTAEVPVKITEEVNQVIQSEASQISLWTVVWVIGMLLCAGYFLIAYLRCRKEFQTSLSVKNEIAKKWLREHSLSRRIKTRQSDRISAPLTYGIWQPVILMPKDTDWENRQQLQYVLMHEYIHIRHFDIVFKLAATLALCVHWFNPLVWALYILYNRDIELACDECVVRQFGSGSKSAYARTLIILEESKSGLTPLCNNFSKNAIEERITAIMKLKKWTIGLVVISAAVIISIVVLFATSAKSDQDVEKLETEGIIGEGVEEDGTALEMAKEVVGQKYADRYINWKIQSLTKKYYYDFGGDPEGLRVTVYQLDYAFLAQEPEKVLLTGSMTIDEEGWVIPEYAGCTYLCLVADGGVLSYQIFVENDCFPGDELFTEDLKRVLGIEEEVGEDVQSLENVMTAFYTAYFEGNVNAVKGYLAESFEGDIEVQSENISMTEMDIKGIKGLDPQMEAKSGDNCVLSLEFSYPNEDSYTYLTVGFLKEGAEWKIASYGLEK